jgi:glycosyltransferase involved in cell wall biosynthesis
MVGHLVYGDAVSADTIAKWRALAQQGIGGDVYCGVADGHHARDVRSLSDHRPGEDEIIVLHYSVWSDVAEYVATLDRARVLLVYHNVTPARWFAGVHRQAEDDTRRGRARLPGLRPMVRFAVADSEYSRRELDEVGFGPTAVVPILVDLARVRRPGTASVLSRLADGYTNILTVGRLAPNKCHEDTIKLFYHYKRRVNPRSRLIVAGAATVGAYHGWLARLVRRLGLEGYVEFAGHITDEDLAAYYQSAAAYVTMSEHEGFCVPLLESMACGVPILAFDSSAVPFTLGDAGVMLRIKDAAVGAEVLRLLAEDSHLRRRMIASGTTRLAEFAPDLTIARFVQAVARTRYGPEIGTFPTN